MILRRLGNKSKIAAEIQKHFPAHKIYIEPFFGAGGMFFNKPKAKYNIVNDLDSDVFNLFQVVSNQKDEFEQAFYQMPIHEDLLEYWKENKETEPIRKALRFLLISNMTWMGIGDKIHTSLKNHKQPVFELLNTTNKMIFDVQFSNTDFRKFLSGISFRCDEEINNTLIYCDPPYLETSDNYSDSFTEQDSIDLFNCLEETGCKWAMSEFDNPFIIEQAKQRNCHVHIIGARQNLKNRRTEILITNYEPTQQLNIF
jgi:DNA adenine methylase